MSEQNYWQPDENEPETVSTNAGPDISWNASEYIHYQKSALWYVTTSTVALALSALAVWLGQWTFAALIVVMAVAIVVYAQRKPREVSYALRPNHIQIGHRELAYRSFRYFAVSQDGPLYVLILVPQRRLGLTETIYFPVELGERIVEKLATILPMHDMERSFAERLAHRIRF